MSQFIGGALPQFILTANDDRNNLVTFTVEKFTEPWRCACPVGEYRSAWWPRGNNLLGDVSADAGVLDSVQWGPYDTVGGISARVGFVGVSRDQYGSPLGNCVVQLFRTSDDLFIMEVTSDSNGNFTLFSWYTPDQHYIVAYKAGSPDVAGTTVNTLTGI